MLRLYSLSIVLTSMMTSGCGSPTVVDGHANKSNGVGRQVPAERKVQALRQGDAPRVVTVDSKNLAGVWWGEAEDGTRFWRRFHADGGMGFGGFWTMSCYELQGSQVLFHASPCQEGGLPWKGGKAFAVLEIERLTRNSFEASYTDGKRRLSVQAIRVDDNELIEQWRNDARSVERFIATVLRDTSESCVDKEKALKSRSSVIAIPIERMRSLLLKRHYRDYLRQYFGPAKKRWRELVHTKFLGHCPGLLQRVLPAASGVLDDTSNFSCPGDTRQAWLACGSPEPGPGTRTL